MTSTAFKTLCLALLLTGCERAPDPEARAPGDAPAPAYRADPDTVQSAVVRALVNVAGPVSLDDRARHRVECQRGDRSYAIEIRQNNDGLSEADIAVQSGYSRGAAKKRLDALCSRISFEMSRVEVKP